jgi:hypothetical protein
MQLIRDITLSIPPGGSACSPIYAAAILAYLIAGFIIGVGMSWVGPGSITVISAGPIFMLFSRG